MLGIKCDRIHPSCGQCVRTGRLCPGYRDLNSVVFRDETARVVNRASARPGNSAAEDAHESAGVWLAPSPSTNRRDQAIGIFFYQYATDVEGCFDYVFSICSRPASPGMEILHDAMELIGLAYLSGMRYGRPYPSSAETEVYRKHSAALNSVNNALQDGSLATRDEVLVAVILLGLFEVSYRPCLCSINPVHALI